LWAAHDLDNINIQFSQNNAAAAGLSLLLLPASQFGVTGPGTSLATFSDWPLAPNTLAPDFSFNSQNTFNDLSLYWNRTLAASIPVSPDILDFDAGVVNHAHLQLDASDGGVSAKLMLTPRSLGTPGNPLSVLKSLFVPGATLGDSRLEFAGRNAGLSTRIDIDNVFSKFERCAPLLLNPGASAVIVHNLAAFESRYGTGLPVAGEFFGSLDNAGDRLTLLGPLGEPILDFSYEPTWYPSTDGGGFSLVAGEIIGPSRSQLQIARASTDSRNNKFSIAGEVSAQRFSALIRGYISEVSLADTTTWRAAGAFLFQKAYIAVSDSNPGRT
jgi:hypothetical protein